MPDGVSPSNLSEQQRRFADFILQGKNQRDAYRLAGYKTTTDEATDANASRLLSNAKVARYIAERQRGAAQKAELTAAHFAKRLERLAAAAERSVFRAVTPGTPAQEDMTDGAEVLALSAKDAADVARQCSMDAAKLLGQIVDQSRVQSENINYTIGDSPMSEDDWEREFGDADAVGAAARTPARTH